MPSRIDATVSGVQDNLDLALVPVVATLLSISEVLRALGTNASGGFTFPFPAGLPTLWTYVSIPNTPVSGGTDPGQFVAFLPIFLVGLLITAALEAGFLGTITSRLTGSGSSFFTNVEVYTLRILGVNLLRAAITFVVAPIFFVSPVIGLPVLLGLMYLLYGLSFVIVANDARFFDALEITIDYATDGGDYAVFAIAHLLIGAVVSFFFTAVVVNLGIGGLLVGTVVVAVPALFVATYGVFLFHDLGNRPITVG